MNQLNLSSLQKYLRTTTDAQELQLYLSTASEKFFSVQKTVDVSLKEAMPYEIANGILTLAREYHITPQDNLQMKTFLKQIGKVVNDFPVVSLTLARAPQEATLALIQEWFIRAYKKNVLLDLKVDRALLAGAIIACKGKYRDYSLRKMLERNVQQSKA